MYFCEKFLMMWNMYLKCFLWDKDSVREMLFFIFLFSIQVLSIKKLFFFYSCFSLHGLTPNEPNKARDQTVN